MIDQKMEQKLFLSRERIKVQLKKVDLLPPWLWLTESKSFLANVQLSYFSAQDKEDVFFPSDELTFAQLDHFA